MKKVFRKIVSCFLVFFVVLCPLFLTGCIEEILNEELRIKLEEFKNQFKSEPTYYIGALYGVDNVSADGTDLVNFTESWRKYSDTFAKDFIEEFASGEDVNNEIRGIKKRSDYFPDFRRLLVNGTLSYGEYAQIASKLALLNYYTYYEVENGMFVLALTKSDATCDDESGDEVLLSSGIINTKYVKVDDQGNIVAPNGATEYSSSDGDNFYGYKGANKTDGLLFHSSWKYFRVYYKKDCAFLVGKVSDFKLMVAGLSSSSVKDDSLGGRVKKYIKALYSTHYNRMSWTLNYDNLREGNDNLVEQNQITQFKSAVSYPDKLNLSMTAYEEYRDYSLAVEVIKDVYFGGYEGLNVVPTAITWSTLAMFTFIQSPITTVVNVKTDGNYSNLGDDLRMTSITLADIYDQVINPDNDSTNFESPEQVLIKSADGTEYLTVNNYHCGLQQLFIGCSYQFLFGIPGVKEDATNYNIIANIVKNVYSEYIPEEEWNSVYSEYVTSSVDVTILDTGNSVVTKTLPPLAKDFVNENQKMSTDKSTFAMSVTTGLAIAESNEQDQAQTEYEDENETEAQNQKKQDEANSKNESKLFFTTNLKRNYYSFTFEAWGQDYSMESFFAQFEYYNDAEKASLDTSKLTGSDDEPWEKIRNHYTFIIEKCVYNGKTKTFEREVCATMKASDSTYINPSDLKQGCIFLDFASIFKANKIVDENKNDVTSLSFHDLLTKNDDTGKAWGTFRSPFSKTWYKIFSTTYDYTVKNYAYTPPGSKSSVYSLAYDKSTYESYKEEYIQIIFAVDSEANRVPLILTDLVL